MQQNCLPITKLGVSTERIVMLVKYKKQANISAGVWLVTLVAFLATPLPSGNIWESGDIPRMLLMTASIAAFWFCFWAYAKAKGYSGWLGVVLPVFSVIGLVILAALKDKHPDSSMEYKAK
jgi:hypothetical protein